MRKILFPVFFIVVLISCKRDEELKIIPDYKGFPENVGEIIINKCAVTGCHNDESFADAEELNLSSWEKLFQGGHSGSVVIPYRFDQSLLLFFINTDTNLGFCLKPTMPYNRSPLSKHEYLTIKNWIEQGAPDENDFVKFSDNPDREKIYVSNQGCDIVTVIDVQTKLAMRYIDVGNSAATNEFPHMVRVAPDRKYWYTIFTAGNSIQRYDAVNDKFSGEIIIGNGNWNTFAISPDSRMAYIIDWSPDGTIAKVDLENMTLIKRYQGSGLFYYPHGIAANQNFSTIYVTAQTGNFIYKIDTADANFIDYQKIVLEKGQPINYNSSLDPHEVMFSLDFTKYFVTCQKSNEVRVLQTSNDSLLSIIPVGTSPVEMSLSKSQPYLFVTCMETVVADTFSRGSIAVINYNTNQKITEISGGLYQPHGLAVDDANGIVYVASRNISASGPVPHHINNCGGRNGFIKLIDLNTLQITDDYKTEVSADPYSMTIR